MNTLDAIADAAAEAHRLFLEKHWQYFYWEGRTHPTTGALIIERNHALDRESLRLFWIKNEASRAALEHEYRSKHK